MHNTQFISDISPKFHAIIQIVLSVFFWIFPKLLSVLFRIFPRNFNHNYIALFCIVAGVLAAFVMSGGSSMLLPLKLYCLAMMTLASVFVVFVIKTARL